MWVQVIGNLVVLRFAFISLRLDLIALHVNTLALRDELIVL